MTDTAERGRTADMTILVINSGSSSLKFQVIDSENEEVLAKGVCERIGIDGRFTYRTRTGISLKEAVPMKNHTQAVHTLLDTLADPEKGVIKDFREIDVIGHRLVHGGTADDDRGSYDLTWNEEISARNKIYFRPTDTMGFLATDMRLENIEVYDIRKYAEEYTKGHIVIFTHEQYIGDEEIKIKISRILDIFQQRKMQIKSLI